MPMPITILVSIFLYSLVQPTMVDNKIKQNVYLELYKMELNQFKQKARLWLNKMEYLKLNNSILIHLVVIKHLSIHIMDMRSPTVLSLPKRLHS